MSIQQNNSTESHRARTSSSSSAIQSHSSSQTREPTNTPRTLQAPAQDPFLFYSSQGNLERARNFLPVDYTNVPRHVQRKTRISFEKDAFTLLMDDILELHDVSVDDINQHVEIVDLLNQG
eukprot:scaffold1516_cov192-Alexandrium_tamarense.AAC.18